MKFEGGLPRKVVDRNGNVVTHSFRFKPNHKPQRVPAAIIPGGLSKAHLP